VIESVAKVNYTQDGSVSWIEINRPDVRNSVDAETAAALWQHLRTAEADASVRVVVLTGSGQAAFCAGADLKEMAKTQLRADPERFPHVHRNLEMTKPLIAAVNGAAYGGGFMLVQMCDVVVASDSATFAVSEARWGRGMPWAAPLSWLLPPKVALEMFLTGNPLSAVRAEQLGLVNHVVPGDELRARAGALAQRIAENAPLSVRAAKQMVYETANMTWSDAVARGDELFADVYSSEDAQIGPRAFASRTQPQWKGR
jgi:enoyl-CoA hydratase/carnithine racemase